MKEKQRREGMSPSNEDIILSNQIDLYHHRQGQAQWILRVFIAAVGLLGLVATPPVISFIRRTELDIPEQNIVWGLTPELADSITTVSPFLAALLLAIALLYVGDGIRFFFEITRLEPPEPTIEAVDDLFEFSEENYPGMNLSQWIIYNGYLLRKIEIYKNRGLRRLFGAAVVSVIGFCTLISGFLSISTVLALLYVFFAALPFLFGMFYLFYLLRDRWESGGWNFRRAWRITRDEEIRPIGITPPWNFFAAFIFFYIWLLSVLFTVVWIS